jgi:hypothetical protein
VKLSQVGTPAEQARLAAQEAAEWQAWERQQQERRWQAEQKAIAAAEAAERFERHHGYTLNELQQAQARWDEGRAKRDADAEYGSPDRPAIMLGDAPLNARESVQRAQVVEQASIARARSRVTPFMQREIEAFEQRQSLRRSAR